MNVEGSEFQDVVSGVASRFQMWEQVLNATGAESLAEVGVWKGDFARHVLQQCGSIERYFMIDPWASLPDWNKPFNVDTQVFEDVYAEAMEKTAFASEKVVVLRGRTKEVIDEIPDESLDFVYIDGDHTLRGITIDLIKVFSKIKKAALFVAMIFLRIHGSTVSVTNQHLSARSASILQRRWIFQLSRYRSVSLSFRKERMLVFPFLIAPENTMTFPSTNCPVKRKKSQQRVK